jgi:tetratricopeptide (TPR) repeat protein
VQKVLVHEHLQNWIGYALFALGFLGDSIAGILLVASGSVQVLLLHLFAALIWVMGINLVSGQFTQQAAIVRLGPVRLNRWSVTALCLSVFPFPGCITLAYSIAIVVAKCSRQRAIEVIPEILPPTRAVALPLNMEIQPLIDILYDSDLEMKRAAVTVLRQQGNPESIQLLRQLLSDTHAELRSDASIALTRLEDELSRVLNTSLAQWIASPHDKVRMLDLADQYYHYACSNVLDEVSRKTYLVKARELVQQCLVLDEANAQLWMKSARIRQRLGQMAETLQDVRFAIELEPDAAEAYLLAMDVAFGLHAWDVLLDLAREGLSALRNTSEVQTSFHYWGTLNVEPQKGVPHDTLC